MWRPREYTYPCGRRWMSRASGVVGGKMLYRFVSGDVPITIVLYLVFWLWARGRVSLLRQVAVHDTPVWNWIGRFTLGIVLAFPVWVTLFDNWRQLLGYGYSPAKRWQSDPFDTALTAEPIRGITVALLVAGLLGCALLYARHRGSIPLAVMWAAIGLACIYFLNPIRIRLDVYLYGTQASLADPRPVDVGFILFWALGLYALIAGLLAAGAAQLFAVVALPVRLVYWLATRGRVEQEAPVYQVFQRKAQALHEPAAGGEPGAPTNSESVG